MIYIPLKLFFNYLSYYSSSSVYKYMTLKAGREVTHVTKKCSRVKMLIFVLRFVWYRILYCYITVLEDSKIVKNTPKKVKN